MNGPDPVSPGDVFCLLVAVLHNQLFIDTRSRLQYWEEGIYGEDWTMTRAIIISLSLHYFKHKHFIWDLTPHYIILDSNLIWHLTQFSYEIWDNFDVTNFEHLTQVLFEIWHNFYMKFDNILIYNIWNNCHNIWNNNWHNILHNIWRDIGHKIWHIILMSFDTTFVMTSDIS